MKSAANSPHLASMENSPQAALLDRRAQHEYRLAYSCRGDLGVTSNRKNNVKHDLDRFSATRGASSQNARLLAYATPAATLEPIAPRPARERGSRLIARPMRSPDSACGHRSRKSRPRFAPRPCATPINRTPALKAFTHGRFEPED